MIWVVVPVIKVESFMKTLMGKAVYLAAYETFEDVTADFPHFINETSNEKRLHFARRCGAN